MNSIDTDSFVQKLKEYDEAFDFYMDYGKLPDNLPSGDLLGGFIGQTIQDNPQLESQDPLWTELLKEELMKFVEAMLHFPTHRGISSQGTGFHCRVRWWRHRAKTQHVGAGCKNHGITVQV